MECGYGWRGGKESEDGRHGRPEWAQIAMNLGPSQEEVLLDLLVEYRCFQEPTLRVGKSLPESKLCSVHC